jgi:hypothetical protein
MVLKNLMFLNYVIYISEIKTPPYKVILKKWKSGMVVVVLHVQPEARTIVVVM